MENTIKHPDGKGITMDLAFENLADDVTFVEYLLENHDSLAVKEIGTDTAEHLYYSDNHLDFGDKAEEKNLYAAFSEEINRRYPMSTVEEDYEDELRSAEIDGDPEFDRHDIARNIQLTVGLKLLIRDFYEAHEEVINLHPQTPLKNLVATPAQAKSYWKEKKAVTKHKTIKAVIEKNYRGKELIAAMGDPYFGLDYFAVNRLGWEKKFEKELLPKEFDSESPYGQFERTVKQRLTEIYAAHKTAILADPELPLSMIIAQQKDAGRENK